MVTEADFINFDMSLTDNEKLMYEILGKISELDTPLVFKGALITKLILVENDYTSAHRPTRDIDANWVSTPPTMERLAYIVNKSLEYFNGKYLAKPIREHGEDKSAGLAILDTATGERIISMDVSMKSVIGSRSYQYGEMEIKGVLANEVLADKISVLSKHTIFRRAKDVIDVYALAHCVEILTAEIFEICRTDPRRHLSTFDEFLNHRPDLEHAYDKFTGIENKPAFDDVYAYLSNFLQPFIRMDETPRLWNNSSLAWDDVCI